MKSLFEEYMEKCGSYYDLVNAEKPVIMTLGTATAILGGDVDGEPEDPVYVVTVSNLKYGAAQIFKPSVQHRLSEVFDGDYYIIPSSLHEVLVLRYDPEKACDLREMLQTVNEAVVIHEDFLSNNLYRYNSLVGTIEAVG